MRVENLEQLAKFARSLPWYATSLSQRREASRFYSVEQALDECSSKEVADLSRECAMSMADLLLEADDPGFSSFVAHANKAAMARYLHDYVDRATLTERKCVDWEVLYKCGFELISNPLREFIRDFPRSYDRSELIKCNETATNPMLAAAMKLQRFDWFGPFTKSQPYRHLAYYCKSEERARVLLLNESMWFGWIEEKDVAGVVEAFRAKARPFEEQNLSEHPSEYYRRSVFDARSSNALLFHLMQKQLAHLLSDDDIALFKKCFSFEYFEVLLRFLPEMTESKREIYVRNAKVLGAITDCLTSRQFIGYFLKRDLTELVDCVPWSAGVMLSSVGALSDKAARHLLSKIDGDPNCIARCIKHKFMFGCMDFSDEILLEHRDKILADPGAWKDGHLIRRLTLLEGKISDSNADKLIRFFTHCRQPLGGMRCEPVGDLKDARNLAKSATLNPELVAKHCAALKFESEATVEAGPCRGANRTYVEGVEIKNAVTLMSAEFTNWAYFCSLVRLMPTCAEIFVRARFREFAKCDSVEAWQHVIKCKMHDLAQGYEMRSSRRVHEVVGDQLLLRIKESEQIQFADMNTPDWNVNDLPPIVVTNTYVRSETLEGIRKLMLANKAYLRADPTLSFFDSK